MAHPETRAYIAFADKHSFDVSLMFHGGAVVANYAYDNCYNSDLVPRPCPAAETVFHARGDEVLPSTRAYSTSLNSKTNDSMQAYSQVIKLGPRFSHLTISLP